MAYRIPRGYDVNRPPYQEISEGVRPSASAVPMEAWTGLPPVRIDELAHDPIVLDAGTIVGIATGGSADGKLFPAHGITGTDTFSIVHHSDGASWGLPTTTVTPDAATLTDGPVLPLGVVFQPIYSFMLQETYTNYKRNENVGVVTDYMIQIPATTAEELLILPGEMVMVNNTATSYGQSSAGTSTMGSFERWDNSAATLKFVVGRCFANLVFTAGTGSTVYSADVSSCTLTTAGAAEFKSLNRVQTVPGLGLGGSGTGGVPSWLMKAYSSSGGDYYALTILVRL